jgi:hypothetical protein
VIDLRLCIQIIQNVKPSAVEKTHLKLNVPTQKPALRIVDAIKSTTGSS